MRLASRISTAVITAFIIATASFARDSMASLAIATSSGRHVFQVEVADSEGEREQGLMNRKSLPADHGMIFVFPRSQPVQFWMKNTFIPLDMIFVDEKGAIAGIKANAKPLSEDIISSPESVRYVIELNGGEAARIKAERGDKVVSDVITAR